MCSDCATWRARAEELAEELAVAHQIGDSFWEALKPLRLARIYVEHPGRHVTDVIRERDEACAHAEAMARALERCRDFLVSEDSGEGGPAYLAAFFSAKRALARLPADALAERRALESAASALREEHVDCQGRRAAGLAAHPCRACDTLAALDVVQREDVG